MSAATAQTAHLTAHNGTIAVLTVANPPVNALSHHVRVALCEGVDQVLADESIRALIILCAGRTFFAGADVKELNRPIEPPLLGDVMAAFEASGKPVIAAMHGTALGGGFELALAAHFRVAVPSTTVGLPEVALGLLPGAGGTQRVPRIIGVEAAVEMIALGRKVGAAEALELGLIDAVVEEGRLEEQAVAFAEQVLREGRPLRRVRDVAMNGDAAEIESIFAAFRARNPELFVGLKAPEGALQAIEAAATLPFEEGIVRERDIARALTASPESAAQRHLFFAERAAAKLPGAEAVKPRALAGVTLQGEVDDRLLRLGLPEGQDAVILCDAAGLDAPSEPDPSRVVGLSTGEGLWEIALGDRTAPEVALGVMAMLRSKGVQAIFVTPGAERVADRLSAALVRAVDRLLAEGQDMADIVASARDYGFGPEAIPGEGGGAVDAGIVEALVTAGVAEARALVAEGRVMRASDIDVAAVKAGLWPLWRGGPAFVGGV